MLLQMALFHSFWWLIFHCIYVPHLLYPFIFWYTFRLSPCIGWGFPCIAESTCNAGDLHSIPGLGISPGEEHGNPLQYSCLENPHGQRSLAGCSPWGHKESDTTEWLSTAWCSLNLSISKIRYVTWLLISCRLLVSHIMIVSIMPLEFWKKL